MQLEWGLLLSFAVFLFYIQAHTQLLGVSALVVMLKERRGTPPCPAECGRWARVVGTSGGQARVARLRTARRSEVSYCGNGVGIPGPSCPRRRSSGAGCRLLPAASNSLQGGHLHLGLFALLGGEPRWGEEMLPASCALMHVLYSAGLTIALYPPPACSFTPLFPSPSYLMQFAVNLSYSLGEAGKALGQGRVRRKV